MVQIDLLYAIHYYYQSIYNSDSIRFDMGQRANFSLLPGVKAALEQLHDWSIKKIESTLKSLNFTDEIIIILDRTSDKTESICRKYTKKIFKGSWQSEGERRNFGIKKCNYNWILEIDADEVINQDLSVEISNAIKCKSSDYYYIRLVNYVGKKAIKYGEYKAIQHSKAIGCR